MEDVDRAYGPLDWRLPYAHAIYWAWSGRPYAEGFERVALTRMILQSLAAALRQGRVVTDPDGLYFMTAPDLSRLPVVIRAFKEAMSAFPDVESFREAYPYLLAEGVMLLCAFGRMDEARNLFSELQRDCDLEETKAGFEAFVFRRSTERGGPARDAALAAVEGAAFQAARWQWFGETDLAEGWRHFAAFLWDYYNRECVSDRDPAALPPLDQLFEKAAREADAAFRSAVGSR